MDTHGVGRLSKLSLGLSLGILWGLTMLIMGWIATCCPYGGDFVSAFGTVYLGYAATFWGAVLGAIWGFFDFFIFGFLIAWIYNLCLCCCK